MMNSEHKEEWKEEWKEGWKQGWKEGWEQGRKQSQLETAQKLKRDGFEPEFIAKYTSLTLSEIAQL